MDFACKDHNELNRMTGVLLQDLLVVALIVFPYVVITH